MSEATARQGERPRLRFDRHELAGAFGDLGTDLPLLLGMILSANLHAASVLVMFGGLQIWTGLWYRLPMPVQPLKAMAAIVIAREVSGSTLQGGGLAVGLMMLALSATGALDALGRRVPKAVVRGVQVGLGLQLASVAMSRFVLADGWPGYVVAAVSFVLVVVLSGNRRIPAALPVVLLGITYAGIFHVDWRAVGGAGLEFPRPHWVGWEDVAMGALVLALPQLPLSVANSVLATQQLVTDLFPERKVTAHQIGLTYSFMNLIAPWFGGVPVCHGSGGLAGHYVFGGRTGGSVVLYGSLFVIAGVFWGAGFEHLAKAFPLPVLGVLLLFESLALMARLGDLVGAPGALVTALLVAVTCALLPYGYVVGMIVGTVLVWRGWQPAWARPRRDD
ncbi:MAG: hypothetical protein KatS3mg077_2733 [Candidatus Binatia bacterium]|nr:MAG: hypothetical protein KatS3mg077_2733 [Candidatus Binatia bacterium]